MNAYRRVLSLCSVGILYDTRVRGVDVPILQKGKSIDAETQQ